MNAWPSLQTLWYDGWALRFADGYTRRANSVNILQPSRLDLADKISHCEKLYVSRGLDIVFKLTPASNHQMLDSILAELGYYEEAPTNVSVAKLDSVFSSSSEKVKIDDGPSDEWIANYCRLSNIDTEKIPVMVRLLKGFFTLRQGDEVLATGLAVIERGYVGLFDIVVDAEVRNRGLGTSLVLNMLAWGRSNSQASRTFR